MGYMFEQPAFVSDRPAASEFFDVCFMMIVTKHKKDSQKNLTKP